MTTTATVATAAPTETGAAQTPPAKTTGKRILGQALGNAGVDVQSRGPVTMASGARKMMLSMVKKSERTGAEKIVLYAPEGWGKTTWASFAPAPIFISTEDGLKGVTVDAFPAATSWQDILDAVEELRTGEHQFKTLVLDTLDWAELLCRRFICERDEKDSIEEYGWGKGYVALFEEFVRLLPKLDALRTEKGMDVLLLAHSTIQTFQNPAGDNYDRYQLKLQKSLVPLVKEWADGVLFGHYKTAVKVEEGKEVTKGKAYGGVKRVIFSNHTAAWDAKNRYGITAEIPFNTDDDVAAFWTMAHGGNPK